MNDGELIGDFPAQKTATQLRKKSQTCARENRKQSSKYNVEIDVR
jgi:hypothetical protein